MPHIWAATGHRPDKLGGYHAAAEIRRFEFAFAYLEDHEPDAVISGMALGWDQAWCAAALQLKIPCTAAVPFEGQERRWPAESIRKYRELLEKCSSVHVVTPGGYTAKVMNDRNKWMVDNSTALIALWDGSDGGTGNCISYAKSVGANILNLWPWWVA